MSGCRASRSSRPVRPLPAVVGARTSPVGRPSPTADASPLARAAATKPVFPAQGALVVRRQHGQAPAPARMQVLDDRAADLLVGEADQHVDRIGRQVPGFDHRYARGEQPLTARLRVHDAGQDDAVRAPADDRVEQVILARAVVPALAEHELIAGGRERVGQRLDGLQEHRTDDGRDHGGDQSAAVRRKAAGQHVRNVAGPVDRLPHAGQRGRGDLLGGVDRARGGDHRDAGQFGHLAQRHPTGTPARTALALAVGFCGAGAQGRHRSIRRDDSYGSATMSSNLDRDP